MDAQARLLLLVCAITLHLFASQGVSGQERKGGLLQPVNAAGNDHGLNGAAPPPDKAGKATKPLLQPMNQSSTSSKQDDSEKTSSNGNISKQTLDKGKLEVEPEGDDHSGSSSNHRNRTGSSLFSMSRPTAPPPDPNRPTNKVQSGLLKPAHSHEDSERVHHQQRPPRPIPKRPTRRPSRLVAKSSTRPTRRPHKSTTPKTTRRPASLLSANRKKQSSTSTMAPTPQLEDYKNGAGDLVSSRLPVAFLLLSAALLSRM